jgi:uncharacterized membrane protein
LNDGFNSRVNPFYIALWKFSLFCAYNCVTICNAGSDLDQRKAILVAGAAGAAITIKIDQPSRQKDATMTIFIIGLAVFLGIHSVRIVAESWRQAQIARLGENSWKLGFSVLSAVGLALIIWGYGVAREAPVILWNPPMGMRHVAGLLTLVAFVFLAAAYVPRNHIKARFHHPMVLGVKAWALGHLLANGTVADLLLFGGFLIWAVFSFIAARRRDRLAGITYVAGTARGTLIAIVGGTAAWAVFAFWLHGVLIGVRPFAIPG